MPYPKSAEVGAGSDPPAVGKEWRSHGHAAGRGRLAERSGRDHLGNPVIVYSFIRPEQFLSSFPRVREFLHRMGRETNQGEIAFEFDGRFYRIRSFDAAEAGGQP